MLNMLASVGFDVTSCTVMECDNINHQPMVVERGAQMERSVRKSGRTVNGKATVIFDVNDVTLEYTVKPGITSALWLWLVVIDESNAAVQRLQTLYHMSLSHGVATIPVTDQCRFVVVTFATDFTL